MSAEQVLSIIPARGGSERLPGKVLMDLDGKPLIAHVIDHALEAESVDRVLVTTDCPEIARVSLEYGAEVPFLRPSVLSGNKVMANGALAHAIQFLEDFDGYVPSIVLALYPTYPFREDGLIDKVVHVMVDDSVVDTCLVGVSTLQHVWSFRDTWFP